MADAPITDFDFAIDLAGTADAASALDAIATGMAETYAFFGSEAIVGDQSPAYLQLGDFDIASAYLLFYETWGEYLDAATGAINELANSAVAGFNDAAGITPVGSAAQN